MGATTPRDRTKTKQDYRTPQELRLAVEKRFGGMKARPILFSGPLEQFDLRVAGDERAWAWLSRDGAYRYGLGRRWHPTHAPLTVCMLNPSTADERLVDPTVRKLLHFAQRDGHGGLVVVNLFALRSADPSYMVDWIAEGRDPVGPANDAAIEALLAPTLPVAAWGAFSQKFIRERVAVVRSMRTSWRCFGTTKDGHPKHPCYLANETRVEPWR